MPYNELAGWPVRGLYVNVCLRAVQGFLVVGHITFCKSAAAPTDVRSWLDCCKFSMLCACQSLHCAFERPQLAHFSINHYPRTNFGMLIATKCTAAGTCGVFTACVCALLACLVVAFIFFL